jgi:hypothetical protein
MHRVDSGIVFYAESTFIALSVPINKGGFRGLFYSLQGYLTTPLREQTHHKNNLNTFLIIPNQC